MPDQGDLTEMLLAWNGGDAAADSALMAAVYDDLRRVARRRLSGARRDDTLTPTALVHETYLRLVAQKRVRWQNRAQFFAVAARLMRRVLIDHVRTRTNRQAGRWRGARETRLAHAHA